MSNENQKQARQAKQTYWQDKLNQWKASKLKVAPFCRQHKLNQEQFRYWQYRLMPDTIARRSHTKETLSFSPATLPTLANSQNDTISSDNKLQIVFPTGHQVRIPSDYDINRLVTILNTMGVITC